jgi:4-hydroxy-tetrahydrodipicolinate synthase
MSMTPEQLRDRIKGIVHMPMTHFGDEDEIDEGAIRLAVQHALKALEGEDAVFLIAGTTAEFYALTDEEVLRIIGLIVEEVSGRFPIIAGTGRAGTKLTIEMSQKAQHLGVDGVLIVPPYYNLATEEGLYRHYKSAAQSIDIGIMVYNNPVASKLWIPPHLMRRLSKIPNVIADKENTPNAPAFYMMQRVIDPQDMVIITGLGHLMFSFEMLYDVPAFVTELVNFAPQLVVDLYRAARNRNHQRVKELVQKLASYDRFVGECARRRVIPTVLSTSTGGSESPIYQSIIKEAMNLVGLPGGKVRQPMENITPEEKEELRKVLQCMGVYS